MDAPKCIDCHGRPDFHCYRCRSFLCEACAKENGGWCQTCTRDTQSPPKKNAQQHPNP